MPAKKSRHRNTTPGLSKSIARGRSQAKEIVALRARQLKKRERAIAALPPQRRLAAAKIPDARREALGSQTIAGLLVAEGDSWFDYPLHDVLSLLEDEHGYEVESVAHKGDRVEDMAYTGGQFEEFARRLEKLLRHGRVPDAILLSGGGNDIAGEEFFMILNHAASGLPVINQDIAHGIIGVRLREAYAFLVSGISEISKSILGRTIPILTHGYDYPIPDGRGFLGGFGPLPGPWLLPGFHLKGYEDLAANTKVMHDLIDTFNNMLQGVSNSPEFKHVHFLDLRKTLNGLPTYKKDWANELHPTRAGFETVTQKFADAIAAL